jgi:hypothetical protein
VRSCAARWRAEKQLILAMTRPFRSAASLACYTLLTQTPLKNTEHLFTTSCLVHELNWIKLQVFLSRMF